MPRMMLGENIAGGRGITAVGQRLAAVEADIEHGVDEHAAARRSPVLLPSAGPSQRR